MAKQHREVLDKLDPVAVARYQITENNIRGIEMRRLVRIRRLQQRLNDEQDERWEDHGYAFERADGQCLFGYNSLVWGRIGAEYNLKLEKEGTKLEEVHHVIPATKRLRWLEVEEIDGDPEEIRAELDEACGIPRPQRVSITRSVTA